MEQGLKSKHSEIKSHIQDKVCVEQIRILHKNLLISIPASFICSIIVVIGLNHNQKSDIILDWFFAIILVSVFRFFSYYLFYYHFKSLTFHRNMFILGAGLAASLWGILDSFLMPANNPYEQLIVIVIVAGVAAGSVQTLIASLTCCLLYVCLAVAPLCIWTFMQQDFIYLLVGITITTYLLFMIATSFRGYKLLTNTLNLRYENDALLQQLTVSNSKLLESYNKLVAHETQIVLINKLNDMLQSCHNIQEAYSVIRLIAKELFVNYNGCLFTLNPDTNQLEIVTKWGDAKWAKSEFSVEDCWAVRKGHEYHVLDEKKELNCNHFINSPRSYVCIPLTNQGQTSGLLTLGSENANSISSDQIQLMNNFSEVIQLSLTNILLRMSLYQQSIHDPLTGLFNRRYLDETLARELKLTKRENKSLCVAMVDVDFFKKFNDTNGHSAGDEILKSIGTLFKESFRESDIACRFGGEEFCIVMVNTAITLGKERLQKISEIVKNRKITYKGTLLPPITISIGVAEAPLHGTTVIDIIRAADEALYRAKENGRNRIEFYNGLNVKSDGFDVKSD